jgi:hypothetical protein
MAKGTRHACGLLGRVRGRTNPLMPYFDASQAAIDVGAVGTRWCKMTGCSREDSKWRQSSRECFKRVVRRMRGPGWSTRACCMRLKRYLADGMARATLRSSPNNCCHLHLETRLVLAVAAISASSFS